MPSHKRGRQDRWPFGAAHAAAAAGARCMRYDLARSAACRKLLRGVVQHRRRDVARATLFGVTLLSPL